MKRPSHVMKIMRANRPDAIEERISRSEGEYERLRVLAALRHAGE